MVEIPYGIFVCCFLLNDCYDFKKARFRDFGSF